MRPTLKKVIAGVTTLATAAVVVPLLTATPAFATPPSPQTGATLSPTSGIGSTSFNLSLPIGASCPGDANAGWRVNTYMVPATVDPATIQWNNSGPVPIATGTNFRQPLYSPTGDVYSSLFTAAADTPGGPGLILALGPADFEVLAPGDIPAGAYNLGIACTNGPASTTQLDKFWNAKMTITANPAGGAAQVSWAVGAVPAAPTLTAVTPADGTLTAAFTPPAGSDPAVTGFTATATPTSGPAVTATGATSPITIPGLTNGTSYSVTVRATNAVGNSAESNALPGTPNLTRVPVQNLVATPGTGDRSSPFVGPTS